MIYHHSQSATPTSSSLGIPQRAGSKTMQLFESILQQRKDEEKRNEGSNHQPLWASQEERPAPRQAVSRLARFGNVHRQETAEDATLRPVGGPNPENVVPCTLCLRNKDAIRAELEPRVRMEESAKIRKELEPQLRAHLEGTIEIERAQKISDLIAHIKKLKQDNDDLWCQKDQLEMDIKRQAEEREQDNLESTAKELEWKLENRGIIDNIVEDLKSDNTIDNKVHQLARLMSIRRDAGNPTLTPNDVEKRAEQLLERRIPMMEESYAAQRREAITKLTKEFDAKLEAEISRVRQESNAKDDAMDEIEYRTQIAEKEQDFERRLAEKEQEHNNALAVKQQEFQQHLAQNQRVLNNQLADKQAEFDLRMNQLQQDFSSHTPFEGHDDHERQLAEKQQEFERRFAEKHQEYSNLLAEKQQELDNLRAEKQREREIVRNTQPILSFEQIDADFTKDIADVRGQWEAEYESTMRERLLPEIRDQVERDFGEQFEKIQDENEDPTQARDHTSLAQNAEDDAAMNTMFDFDRAADDYAMEQVEVEPSTQVSHTVESYQEKLDRERAQMQEKYDRDITNLRAECNTQIDENNRRIQNSYRERLTTKTNEIEATAQKKLEQNAAQMRQMFDTQVNQMEQNHKAQRDQEILSVKKDYEEKLSAQKTVDTQALVQEKVDKEVARMQQKHDAEKIEMQRQFDAERIRMQQEFDAKPAQNTHSAPNNHEAKSNAGTSRETQDVPNPTESQDPSKPVDNPDSSNLTDPQGSSKTIDTDLLDSVVAGFSNLVIADSSISVGKDPSKPVDPQDLSKSNVPGSSGPKDTNSSKPVATQDSSKATVAQDSPKSIDAGSARPAESQDSSKSIDTATSNLVVTQDLSKPTDEDSSKSVDIENSSTPILTKDSSIAAESQNQNTSIATETQVAPKPADVTNSSQKIDPSHSYKAELDAAYEKTLADLRQQYEKARSELQESLQKKFNEELTSAKQKIDERLAKERADLKQQYASEINAARATHRAELEQQYEKDIESHRVKLEATIHSEKQNQFEKEFETLRTQLQDGFDAQLKQQYHEQSAEFQKRHDDGIKEERIKLQESIRAEMKKSSEREGPKKTGKTVGQDAQISDETDEQGLGTTSKTDEQDAELLKVKKQLSELQDKNKLLQADFEAVQDARSKLSREFDDSVKKEQLTSKALDSSENQVKHLETVLEGTGAIVVRQRTQISKFDRENNQLHREVNDLKLDLALAHREAKEANEDVVNLRFAKHEAEANVNSLKNANEELLQTNNDLALELRAKEPHFIEEQLEIVTRARDGLETDLAIITEENETLVNQDISQRQEIRQCHAQLGAVQSDLNAANSRTAALSRDLHEAQQSKTGLLANISRLRAENVALEAARRRRNEDHLGVPRWLVQQLTVLVLVSSFFFCVFNFFCFLGLAAEREAQEWLGGNDLPRAAMASAVDWGVGKGGIW